jgi:hypothetical protein
MLDLEAVAQVAAHRDHGRCARQPNEFLPSRGFLLDLEPAARTLGVPLHVLHAEQ